MKKVKITNTNGVEIEVSPEFAKVIDQMNNCKPSEIPIPSNEIPIDRQILMLDLLCLGNEDTLLNIIRFRYGINPKRNSFSDNIYCDGFKIENLQSILNYIESLENQTDNYDHLKLIKSVITKIISDVNNYKSRETSITFGQLPIDKQIQILDTLCLGDEVILMNILRFRYGINANTNSFTGNVNCNGFEIENLQSLLNFIKLLEDQTDDYFHLELIKSTIEKITEKRKSKKIIDPSSKEWFKVGLKFADGTIKYKTARKDSFAKITETAQLPLTLRPYVSSTYQNVVQSDKNIFNNSKWMREIYNYCVNKNIQMSDWFLLNLKKHDNY